MSSRDLDLPPAGSQEKLPGKNNRSSFIQTAFLLLLLMLSSPGCLEQIDLEVPQDIQSAIVIQGKLVKGDPSIIQVEISALFNFSGSSRRLIDVLEVLLLDEAGQSLKLPTVDLGIYALEIPEDHPSFRIEAGANYRIRVATRDGRVYESTPEPLITAPSVQKLSAEIIDKEIITKDGEFDKAKYVRFFIDTPLATTENGKKARFKWDAFLTYQATDLNSPAQTCYVTALADVTRLWLLDGNLITGDQGKGITVHEEPVSSRFAEGFYLTLLQQSLSEGAFRYWSEADELIERTGSIFEPPAGKIRSNFINVNDPADEAFGFFYAIDQDTSRLFVSPEMTGSPAPFCPPNGPLYSEGGTCLFPLCCDCATVPGSTLTKPDFWVE